MAEPTGVPVPRGVPVTGPGPTGPTPTGPSEPPDAVFAALADPTRRSILATVAESGPVTATNLADRLPISRQAVAKHLALLRDAGLVTADRAGRETRFTAVTGPLDQLASWAQAAGRRWDARLDRLRQALEP